MADVTREKVEYLMKGLSAKFRGALKPNQEKTFSQFCTIVESDGSAVDYDWLDAIPDLRPWIGGRVLNDLSSSTYTIKNRKFEGSIRVKADDIRDDKTAHYGSRAELLAAAANRWEEGLAVEAITRNGLCFDQQNFFDTDHKHGKTDATFSNDNPDIGSFDGSSGSYVYLMDTSKPVKPIIFQSRQQPQTKMLTNPESDHVFKYDEYLMGVDSRGESGYSFWQLAMRVKPADSAVATMRGLLAGARTLGASLKNEHDQKLGIRYDTILCDTASEVVIRQAVEAQYVDSSFTPNVIRNQFKIQVIDRL